MASLLRDDVRVTCLVRDREKVGPGRAYWNPETDELDPRELEGFDAVVHLAGAGIADGRWTKARKRVLLESRVRSTALLAHAIASCQSKPGVLVSASGVGFYGNQPDTAVDEQSLKGDGFLADVCAQWEAATTPASDAGVRVARARFGLVMSLEGGALPKMLRPIRAGVGGHLGTGKQFVPWVTLRDAVSALRFAIADPTLAGAVNVVAPEPCTNREMTLKIATACGRRTLMPVPAFALRAALGEMADELLLSGANVRPRVLERAGFRFDDPRLEDALSELLQGATVA